MPGKLKNRTRRALTFNLTTKVAPVRHVFKRRTEQKDGSVTVGDRRLILPDSVTILSKGFSDSLPDGVPFCPEVAAAIARRDVEWIPDASVKEQKAKAQVAEVAADDKAEPRSRRAQRAG